MKRTIKELTGLTYESSNDFVAKRIDEILDKTLTDALDGDLAFMIRQDLGLDVVIPEAIRRLEKNPLAGDLYQGELMVSMSLNLDGVAQFSESVGKLVERIQDILPSLKFETEYDKGKFKEALESLTQRENSVGRI